MKTIAFLVLSFMASLFAFAQPASSASKEFAAALRMLRTEHIAQLQRAQQESAGAVADEVAYIPYLTAQTFAPQTLERALALNQYQTVSDGASPYSTLNSQHLTLSDGALMRFYAQHPEYIRYQLVEEAPEAAPAPAAEEKSATDGSVQATAVNKGSDPVWLEPEWQSPALDDEEPQAEEVQIEARKPNFWTFKGNFLLQFTQTYLSENWYKGGENNLAFLAQSVLEANYDNKKKVTFDNKLEMKLGFQTTRGDELHKFRTNADQLRLTDKLGIQATKHWYYAIMLQTNTQFYKGHKSNDPKVYSDFCSPLESMLSFGMDYKLNKKKFQMSATLSPLAVKFKYVARPSLITNFGLEPDHHVEWAFGSTFTINTSWDICKNVNWKSRLYYFTNYKQVQAEWENTFTLRINNFLSTSLYLYPRFDDSYDSKIQFFELLSVGFNYNF